MSVTSIDLFPLVLGVFVTGLLFSGGMTGRPGSLVMGYLPFAWLALIVNGIIGAFALPDPLKRFFGILFASLLLAGSLQYARRPVPRFLLRVAIAVGLAHVLLAFSGFAEAARLSSVLLEVGLIVCAAAVIHSEAKREGGAWVDGFIAPGLLLLAGLDALEHFLLVARQVDIGIMPWFLVGLPVVAVQAVSQFERIRRNAEEADSALKETVSRLEATLESTTDGILVVDRNRKYSSFNRIFAEMWDLPPEILERRGSEESLAHVKSKLADPAAFYERVESLYAHPERDSFDTIRLKDGRIFERYSRPQWVDDEVVGRVWSFRDVTERKNAEEIAARYQDHLEELVEERSRALIESRERLREADRLAALGTLTAGIAHQINNPIGAILNASEFALLSREDADSRETFVTALEVCGRESRRCAAIVRSMLQFARDEEVDTQIEDLNRVARRACRAIAGYARERRATISLDLFETPLWVRMSVIEIEQALVNILRNSVESGDEGVRVRVRSGRRGDFAHVEIRDDGNGIKDRDLARIFDHFYSTRLNRGGTGLGLSVAHGIVSQHAGRLSVSSEVGRGSVFAMALPLCEKEPEGWNPDPDARSAGYGYGEEKRDVGRAEPAGGCEAGVSAERVQDGFRQEEQE